MHLERLKLRDFRNFEALDLQLDPGFNLIVGKNAQGKTNLLEAIYFIGTGKRLRGMRDHEAIRQGASSAHIEVTLAEGRTSVSLDIFLSGRKSASINGQSLPKASDLLGRVPVVAFSASDLPILRGEPSERRAFLDLHLSQIYPRYLTQFSAYKQALAQRNSLLKLAQKEPVEASLFVPWEMTMSVSAEHISLHRERYLADLKPEIQARHAQLGSGERITLELESTLAGLDAAEIADRLAESRERDIQRGSTSLGPHRDEWILCIDQKDARRYGSQGQQRTAVIALKLAVFRFLEQSLGQSPVLLLDDIFSDLDHDRRQKLIEIVAQEAGQVVLTCTDAAQAGAELGSHARRIVIEQGKVSE